MLPDEPDNPPGQVRQDREGPGARIQLDESGLRALELGQILDPYSAARSLAYSGRSYNPAELRERTRATLAKALLLVLGLAALGLIALTADRLLTLDQAKDLAAAILSPLIALTGAVFGFYYGGHGRDGGP
jgi:hypothetical protein